MLWLSDDQSDTSSYGSFSVTTLSLLRKRLFYLQSKIFQVFLLPRGGKSCKILHFEGGSCISPLIEKQRSNFCAKLCVSALLSQYVQHQSDAMRESNPALICVPLTLNISTGCSDLLLHLHFLYGLIIQYDFCKATHFLFLISPLYIIAWSLLDVFSKKSILLNHLLVSFQLINCFINVILVYKHKS